MFCLKLLQRLLEDRKSTVDVIKREGEKIAASAEPADRVKLTRQLSLLDSRWEALLSRAEARYPAACSGLWAGVMLAFKSTSPHLFVTRLWLTGPYSSDVLWPPAASLLIKKAFSLDGNVFFCARHNHSLPTLRQYRARC